VLPDRGERQRGEGSDDGGEAECATEEAVLGGQQRAEREEEHRGEQGGVLRPARAHGGEGEPDGRKRHDERADDGVAVRREPVPEVVAAADGETAQPFAGPVEEQVGLAGDAGVVPLVRLQQAHPILVVAEVVPVVDDVVGHRQGDKDGRPDEDAGEEGELLALAAVALAEQRDCDGHYEDGEEQEVGVVGVEAKRGERAGEREQQRAARLESLEQHEEDGDLDKGPGGHHEPRPA
jgi:hypothetical protein